MFHGVDTAGRNLHTQGMNSIVVKCAFCTRRHLIPIEEIDVWYVQCGCGAHGFIEDDMEITESGHDGPGFTVRESSDFGGKPIWLSDPHTVYVDEWSGGWHVSWFVPLGWTPGP